MGKDSLIRPLTIPLGFGEVVVSRGLVTAGRGDCENVICGSLILNALKEKQKVGSPVISDNVGNPLVNLVMTEEYIDNFIEILQDLKNQVAGAKVAKEIKIHEDKENGYRRVEGTTESGSASYEAVLFERDD